MTLGESAKVSRSLLRYYGGKWRLANWIISTFQPHRVYVEPFGGGAGVLLRKPRSYAEVYNDLDEEIVNVFRQVRDHGEELRALLHATPFARAEFMNAYIPSSDPLEQARRTLILSFMGFGGDALLAGESHTGFRANTTKKGGLAAHNWADYSLAIPSFTERLRGVVIENRDACDVMLKHDGKDTLHYVDPPYVWKTRSTKSGHQRRYRCDMDQAAHKRLAETLHALKGQVVLSGYACPLYDHLYRDWRRVKTGAQADGARPRFETLWLSRGTAQVKKPRTAEPEAVREVAL